MTTALTTPARRFKFPKLKFGATTGAIWLIVVTFLAFTADWMPFIRDYDDGLRRARNFKIEPGADFWFGSDRQGRDVFARSIYGGKLSLLIAFVSILIGVIVGGALGMIAGYRRGWFERVINVATDSMLALPALVVAILVVGRFDALRENVDGFSWLSRSWSILFVLSLLSVAPIARIVRAQTLSLSQREFVLAARSLGAKPGRIIFREIVPNLVPAMVSVAFTGIAILLVAEGGLAFLGYSIERPVPSWGGLISDGRPDLRKAWWPTLFPCFMLFFTVLAFNLIGDRLARRFDIREAAL